MAVDDNLTPEMWGEVGQALYKEDRFEAAAQALSHARAESLSFYSNGWMNLTAMIDAEQAAATTKLPSQLPGVEIHVGLASMRDGRAPLIDAWLRDAMDRAQTVFGHAQDKPLIVCLIEKGVFPRKYSGGCFVPKTHCDKILLVNVRTILQQALCHEYCHVAVHHTSASAAPRWLDEGLADFFMGGYEGPAPCPISVPPRFGTPLSWAEATLTSRERDRDAMRLAYETADSFVGYLIHRCGLPAIVAYLRHLARGIPDLAAFPLAFGCTLTTLENEWWHPTDKPR